MKPKTIQKLMGVGMIVLGVLSAIVSDGDCTAAILFVPLGLAMVICKDNLIGIVDDEYIESEDEQE